ncbi:MAG: Ca-activated chloride channel family protein [Pseudomonas sp.]|jgi:Ca-activated chloride channel family protein
MWQFDALWVFALLPLPWLAWHYLPAYQEARRAVRTPFFTAISEAIGARSGTAGQPAGRAQLGLNLLAWLLLLSALARPVWIEPAVHKQQPLRDLLLAIDISQSMQARDYLDPQGQQVDRLSAVKAVVSKFIAQRPDDRMGLIVFGGGAFPQAPLTTDHASLQILLSDIGIGMAGPNTAIGDAIGLSIKMLEHSPQPEKVLILLTDGNDNSSAISPDQAANLAAAAHIRIHSIGIGDLQASGEQKVDRAVLQRIARSTGGRSFMAGDSQALAQVYTTLDQLTPHQVQTLSHQPKRQLFWLPLGAALVLLCLYHTLALLFSRVPMRQPSQHGEGR